jgi:hypothetical protein
VPPPRRRFSLPPLWPPRGTCGEASSKQRPTPDEACVLPSMKLAMYHQGHLVREAGYHRELYDFLQLPEEDSSQV